MRYTIITPTLLRDTLHRLCESIERQTYSDWQHVVVVDVNPLLVDESMIDQIEHPQRLMLLCGQAHRDSGNTCRRNGWDYAQGDYVFYIDDDNYFADDDVLETLRFVTQPVALFPLLFMGEQGPVEPVSVGSSDGNQLLVRRDIGRWPNLKGTDTDGIFIRDLTDAFPYDVYEERPLVVYEYARHGA